MVITMKTKSPTCKTSLLTLMVVLLVPILFCFIKGPNREIEARTSPTAQILRGSIFDRTGTLLAFSQIVTQGVSRRVYPYGDLAKSLIGGLDPMGRGISGIELSMDQDLSKGEDVVLTLEREVQIRASDLVQLQLKRFRATYGCMIVMDLLTGDVLALASRGKMAKGPGHAVPAPYEERLFRAGGILLPLRWHLENGVEAQESSKSLKRASWVSIGDKYLVWSPWDEDFILKVDEARSYTKELIGLGLGKAPDRVPLYVTHAFNGAFKATPLHILHAFARLLTGEKIHEPRFVKGKGDEASGVPFRSGYDGEAGPGMGEDFDEHREQTAGKAVHMFKKTQFRFTVPALATVWWDTDNKRKARRTCEIMALGYWPEKSPRVVYITAVKGALNDPRRVPGYLSKAKGVLRAADQIPVARVMPNRQDGRSLELSQTSRRIPEAL